MNDFNDMVVLGSDKVILSAQHYSDDSFTGVVQGELFFRPDMEVLNQAYRALITKKTGLNILFSRGKSKSKRIQLIPFVGVREFKSAREVEEWKGQKLDMDLGPYQELGVLFSPWPWVKRTKIYAKSHHLIFDGFSVLYVWEDLCKLYGEILTQGTSHSVAPDARVYRVVMDRFLALERENHSAKRDFWINYLKGHDSWRRPVPEPAPKPVPEPAPKPVQWPTQKPVQEDSSKGAMAFFSLSAKCVQKFHRAKVKYRVDSFSALTGVYSRTLQRTLGITFLCLRVPSSFRHHLKTSEELRLMANLARSFPLFIHCTGEKAGVIAQKNKIKMKELVDHLPLSPLPWDQSKLGTFSALKGKPLYFSLSCLPFRIHSTYHPIQNFCWTGPPLVDLELMVLLSKQSLRLVFTYKKSLFKWKEMKEMARALEKGILHF